MVITLVPGDRLRVQFDGTDGEFFSTGSVMFVSNKRCVTKGKH